MCVSCVRAVVRMCVWGGACVYIIMYGCGACMCVSLRVFACSRLRVYTAFSCVCVPVHVYVRARVCVHVCGYV